MTTVWPDMKRATAPGPDRAEPVEAPRDPRADAAVPPVDAATSGVPLAKAGCLEIAMPPAASVSTPKPRRSRRRLGLVAALVLSAAAHAALIGYLVEHLRPEGIEAVTDAVSVELLFETELAMNEPSARARGQTAAQSEPMLQPPADEPVAESHGATPVEAGPPDQMETALVVTPEPDQPSADHSPTPIGPETAETLAGVAPDPADAIIEPEIAKASLAAEMEDGAQTTPPARVEPEALAPAPVEPAMDAAAAQPPIDAPALEPVMPVEAVEPDVAAVPQPIAETPPDTVVKPETPLETSAAEPTPPEAPVEATSPSVEPYRAPTTLPVAEMSGSSATELAPPETAPLPVEPPPEQAPVEAVPVEPDPHLPERMALIPSARPTPPAAPAERAAAPARQQRASPRETAQAARTPPQRRQAASPQAASPPAASHRGASHRGAAPTAREARRPAANAPTAAPSRAASAGAQEQYARRLARHVERYKRYPAAAARQRITGVTRIAITIDRSGGLVGTRMAAASGHAVLDEEAVAIARRAAPYPRPPDGIGDRNFSFTVALRFAR